MLACQRRCLSRFSVLAEQQIETIFLNFQREHDRLAVLQPSRPRQWRSCQRPLFTSTFQHRPEKSTCRRCFAGDANELLANEKLVSTLIQKSGGMSADDLQVRVIIDNGCDTDAKPRPRLMSLAEAIKAAIDLDNRDIMALSLDQEIPVLRIDRLNSFRYKQSKRVATKSVTKKQLEKEFRFNAGIEENDLKRKVETISETLEKGATCIVSIRCKNWALRNDPDIVKTTANRVLDGLKGVAELMNDVKIVGDGTRAQFRLRPAK